MESIIKLITKHNKFNKFTKSELVQMLTMIEQNKNLNFYIEAITFTRTNEYKLSQELANIFVPENYNKIMEMIENPKILFLGKHHTIRKFIETIDCPNIVKLIRFTKMRTFQSYEYEYDTDEYSYYDKFKLAYYSGKYISANAIYVEFKLEDHLMAEFRNCGIDWDMVENIPSIELDKSKLTEIELNYYKYLREHAWF